MSAEQVALPTRPRLAVVSRGDPLTPYLHAALAERYPIVADIDVELRGVRRAVVGALSLRPTWSSWSGRYMKSNTGFVARSRLARRALDDVEEPYDLVLQTHALFCTEDTSAVLYVDCTYREAMTGWPDWAPLRGHSQRRWLRAERATYRAARHLFTFTTSSRDSLIADYGIRPHDVTVVGAGVNFRADPRDLQRTPDRQPEILFVGKDFERKGGRVLLEASAIVRTVFPAVRLQVVGTRLPGHVPDGVEVLGTVHDRARMDELYSRATLFCLPSLFDPAPLAVLEAMAHGLPCVLSRAAAAHVTQLVDDGSGGSVAETGDAVGLAAALLAYLRDPSRAARAGETARRTMTEHYTWARVVDRMAPALQQLSAQVLDVKRS